MIPARVCVEEQKIFDHMKESAFNGKGSRRNCLYEIDGRDFGFPLAFVISRLEVLPSVGHLSIFRAQRTLYQNPCLDSHTLSFWGCSSCFSRL